MMSMCPKCGLPKFYDFGGYAGPQCECDYTGISVVTTKVRGNELESLRAELEAVKKERDEYQRISREQFTEMLNLQEQLAAVTKELDEWKHEFNAAYKRETILEEQLAACQQELRSTKANNNEYIKVLEDRVEEYQQQRDELLAALDKYRGQIDQYGNHSSIDALAKLDADKTGEKIC